MPKIDIPLIKTIPDDVDIDGEDTPSQADGDTDNEKAEESNVDERILKRGPDRARKIKTGNRGQPLKQYCTVEANYIQESFLAEVPIDQAFSGLCSHEWYDAIGIEMKNIIENET